jgi:hypothetical protein
LLPVFPAALARLATAVRLRKEPDGCFVAHCDSHTETSPNELSYTNPDVGFGAESEQRGEHVAGDPADEHTGELVEDVDGALVPTLFEGATDLGVDHEASKRSAKNEPNVPSSPEVLEYSIAKT